MVAKDIEISQMLINAGADVNAQSVTGISALDQAVIRSASNQDQVKLLINAGANVNMRDSSGMTPLMRAIFQKETVELLLNSGADINIRDNKGRTALDGAEEVCRRAFDKSNVKVVFDIISLLKEFRIMALHTFD